MQDMRATGDAQCAPFVSLCPSLVGGPDGLDCSTDCHACSNRDVFPPLLPRPDNKRMLGAAFFAYADEYLLDVKFGSPKVGRDFQRWSCDKKSSISRRVSEPLRQILRPLFSYAVVERLARTGDDREGLFAPERDAGVDNHPRIAPVGSRCRSTSGRRTSSTRRDRHAP